MRNNFIKGNAGCGISPISSTEDKWFYSFIFNFVLIEMVYCTSIGNRSKSIGLASVSWNSPVITHLGCLISMGCLLLVCNHERMRLSQNFTVFIISYTSGNLSSFLLNVSSFQTQICRLTALEKGFSEMHVFSLYVSFSRFQSQHFPKTFLVEILSCNGCACTLKGSEKLHVHLKLW